ncbi:MAG TPA: hypothetical protein VMF57_05955 [Solirubrobacteraceae bacterium]|nr:hypothetical protein [Solirubrobacteraceae bacterium]
MDSEELFKEARETWRAALRNHVLAPPDAEFSTRLATLADAAKQRAKACQAADKDGYEWPAARGGAKPPYELQPDTGRRGPQHLWEQFDDAVAELDRVSEGRSMRAVARAYTDLANIAQTLATAITQQDQAAGLLPARKARRTAR